MKIRLERDDGEEGFVTSFSIVKGGKQYSLQIDCSLDESVESIREMVLFGLHDALDDLISLQNGGKAHTEMLDDELKT